LTRRDMLKGSAAVAAGLAFSTGSAQEPQKRLRVGIIGVGGKGWSGMEEIARFGDIVGLCDIDSAAVARGLVEHPRAATFDDYRVMLEAMKGDLDAVVISTPDHHHAPASALAMRQGIHSYTEKPLTRTIWEARELAHIARRHRVATQMGNQSTSFSPMRQTAAALRAGHLGAVKEIHLWTDRAGGWWKQGHARPEPKRPPASVDFDQWLGPRPDRPFGDGYHPFAWRGWWDFGTGSLGDMGCHIFNCPFMAYDLRDPLTVQAKTSGHNRDSFPEWAIVTYEFGARGDRGPVILHWYDGGKRPDPALVTGHTYGGNGVIIVCERGTVYSPNEFNNEFHVVGGPALPKDIAFDESPGHMAEFARACLGGPPAKSNMPDYSGPLTETVLLGNLAIWADGPKLAWDARNMRVQGTNEFDSLIRPSFRPGWAI
jgi:predicted dehydrogenase